MGSQKLELLANSNSIPNSNSISNILTSNPNYKITGLNGKKKKN